MKKQLILLGAISLFALNHPYMFAQSSSSSNNFSSGNYLGWGSTSGDLDLKTQNVVRARFINASGFLGLGNASSFTAQNFLHLYNSSAANSLAQFTNSTTNSSSSDGFLVGVNGSGQAILNQQENQ